MRQKFVCTEEKCGKADEPPQIEIYHSRCTCGHWGHQTHNTPEKYRWYCYFCHRQWSTDKQRSEGEH